MATTDFFWKLFAQTGSINAYLAYRRVPPSPSPG
ncbi:MAG: YqzL family protein [Vulcanimicrobiaceae bacterium]